MYWHVQSCIFDLFTVDVVELLHVVSEVVTTLHVLEGDDSPIGEVGNQGNPYSCWLRSLAASASIIDQFASSFDRGLHFIASLSYMESSFALLFPGCCSLLPIKLFLLFSFLCHVRDAF